MKIIISLMLIISSICIAQHNTFNKEAELQKFIEQGGKVEETVPNNYKLTYRDGTQKVFNFGRSEKLNNNIGDFNTTIINVWEIDTTEFAGMFKFWQKVEVANSWWRPMFIEDLNKNGLPELYGFSDYTGFFNVGPVQIFERSASGVYQSIFIYDSTTTVVKGMGDIHRTGGKEIYLRNNINNNGSVYRGDSTGSLPTKFDFTFYYTPIQINYMNFGDFDNNNVSDCVFIDGSGAQYCIIGEFRDSLNNFETVFEFSTTDQGDFSNTVIGDFDQDQKTEIVFSSGRGNIFVIENKNENEYQLIDQFPFVTWNAYMITQTNDIDGNGKPEFWVGGQDFSTGASILQAYESDGNYSYTPVTQIELRYSTSLYMSYLQAVDINDDSTEELVISIGNQIFILKFIGAPNQHDYQVLYAKLCELTQPDADYGPTTIADLDGDGKSDILIPFWKVREPIFYSFSYILRQNDLSKHVDRKKYITNARIYK
ncbi:MAG: hypothetical protein M5U17_00810 [Ignavibacterium sp.]|nr:hypothetical protein [Ignavibacterium sp.]